MRRVQGTKMLIGALMAVAVAAGPTIALAASRPYAGSPMSEIPEYDSIQGKLTAMNLKADTMQVMASQGTTTGPVRMHVSDVTLVHQGILPKKLADLKVGEDVAVTYDGSAKKWEADNINILDPSVPIEHYLGLGAR